MYQPSQEILEKYADVLVNFALGGGKGIKKGESVFVQVPESAKAILNPLVISILKAGGHPQISFLPEGADRWMSVDRAFLENATDEQIKFLPQNYLLARVKDHDHFLTVLSTNNKKALEGIPSQKIMMRQAAMKFYKDARDEKENRGKLTWTLALFGTKAMAKEAGLTLKEYWNQIIKACFLDEKNPILKWKKVFSEIEELRVKLNDLEIEKLDIKGKNVDLTIRIGKGRQWLGGSGRNIPSFEIFISPDARVTNGWVKFSEPLYVYGNKVLGVEIEFRDGKVINAKAKKNQKLLRDMIATKGADRVGEFSLTDKRFSKISHFMADTLFDENMGGSFGNFHIALGSAYKDSYIGDPSKVSQEEWEKLGFNDSSVHTDIISTDKRVVKASLKNGEEKIIYKDGKFTI